MSYYGMGDYYGVGDPGLWGTLKRGAGRVARFVAREALPGPLGTAARVLIPAAAPTTRTAPTALPFAGAPTMGSVTVDENGMTMRRRRRRMNFANGRALTRANRRIDGFVRLARRTLKHTNYRLVSKSAGRGKKKPDVIVETGPGGVRV